VYGADTSGGLPSTGGVARGLDEDFSRFHQPQFKWNMHPDIYIQDIGYTIEDALLSESCDVANVDLGARTDATANTSGLAVSVSQQGTADLHEITTIDASGVSATSLDGTFFTIYDNAGSVAVWFDM